MRRQPIEVSFIGRFDGKAGDQFSQAEADVDVFLGDCTVDPVTDERLVELVLRADHPVDEDRIYVQIPFIELSKLFADSEDKFDITGNHR